MSFVIRCQDCQNTEPFNPTSAHCSKCNGQWRYAEYDLAAVQKIWNTHLAERPFNLWKYHELLPVLHPNPSISLGEGGTPLIKAENLGLMLGCPNIYIKDERQGPTSSFKDRQAAVTIAALKEAGITELVAASTGNVAIAYSAYAARAGIKLWAFVTSLVPAVKMREIALYGSQVVKVTGSYDQTKQMAAEFALQRGLYHDMGARTITSVESMKTMAFEIAEQLTAISNGYTASSMKTKWRTPDWYIQSVSGGMGPLGVIKGFRELQKMGYVDKLPAIAAIQSEGCAPMVTSWKQGLETPIIVTSPQTYIETLATGDPGRTYKLLKREVDDTHGVFESVTDNEAFRAMHVIAKMEGISVEPAAGVAFAGLFKLIRNGMIQHDAIIVINCTGHTMPAEQFILGDNWSRDIELTRGEELPQQDGLLAALNRVAPDRFPRILVADDSTDARRLIRRILQSQGDFTIFEAEDGKQALEIIGKEKPDLIILDLMMPQMDGFAVIEILKRNPETANIPVIVASAKELTVDEKNRLEGQIQSLMQKGDFLNDEFLKEVRALLD
jgi:threonine synthase